MVQLLHLGHRPFSPSCALSFTQDFSDRHTVGSHQPPLIKCMQKVKTELLKFNWKKSHANNLQFIVLYSTTIEYHYVTVISGSYLTGDKH